MSTTTSRTVTVAKPIHAVWAYLSDFTTSAEWDPHTVSCRRLDSGPLSVGARFENTQRIAGHTTTPLTYRVTELTQGERVVLEGGNETVHTRDQMVFTSTSADSTSVTYIVGIQLQGAAKIGQLLVPVLLKKIADDGARGMREQLDRLPA